MRVAPDPTPVLPEDAAALRALLLASPRHRPSAMPSFGTDRCAMAEQDDRLRHLLLRLKRLQFGARSERLPEEQLQLGLEDLGTAIAAGGAEAEKRDPELRRVRAAKRRASRSALAGPAVARCRRTCRGWR